MSLSFTQSPTQTQLQQQQRQLQLQIPIKRRCVVENCENFLCGLDGARLGLVWPSLPRLGSPRRFVNNKWNANFQLHQKIISASNRRCCCCCCNFYCCCCCCWGSVDILNNCCALGTLHSAAAHCIAFGGSRSKTATQPLLLPAFLFVARYDKNFWYPSPPCSLCCLALSSTSLSLLPRSLCCLSLSRSVRFWPSSVWVYSPFAQLNFRNDCLSRTGLSTPDSGSVTGSSLIRQSGTRHQPSIHPSIGY